jgi:hypothetical protein
MLHYRSRNWSLIIFFLTTIVFVNCARVGLITDNYDESFYKVPELMPDKSLDHDPIFLIYSDTQAGWRGQVKFLSKKNWATWKMLIFPFYELYWLGNGTVGGINWLRHNPDYAEEEQRIVRDAIYGAAKTYDVDFILNTGDICASDGRRPKHWASFLQMNKIDHPLLNEIPYFPVPGNHDRTNDKVFGQANYNAVFGQPEFFVVDFPDGMMVVLNSNFIIDQNNEIDSVIQEQLFREWFVSELGDPPSWLEEKLSARDIKFKIVAMHHPPISFGMHHTDWYDNSFGDNLVEKRGKLIRLFEEYNVDLVFSGHDHFYQHNYVNGKCHFVVGGGGGTPLRDPVNPEKIDNYIKRYKDFGLNVELEKLAKEYHYSLVSFENNNMIVRVYGVSETPDEKPQIIDEIIISAN